jgi:hypothetical protein
MKIVITIVLLFSFLISKAQIDMPPELSQKLRGKTKFEDIKNTVLEHYNSKLNVLQLKDSTVRKQIMRQLKKWNRQFWISEYYTGSNGIVQDATTIDGNAFKILQNNTSTNNALARQNINWINFGPNNSNNGIGRIDKIAFHPTNPNIIYAGSPHGGLFKTINGGASWFNTSPNLPSLGIAGIVIDPTNPQIVYVLSGDANTNGGCFIGGAICLPLGDLTSASQGVFKTFDGGNNWVQTGKLELSNTLYRGRELIMDPNNPNVLLAATSVGIFKTTNGAGNWIKLPNLQGNDVADIKFKPGNSNIIFATNLGNGASFFKSSDAGTTFTNIPITGLNAYRIAIGVTPANPNRVILLSGKAPIDSTYSGIFTSNDAGDFFGQINSNVVEYVLGGQADYDICIAISTTNENDIYIGGLNVWRSQNGGFNWSQISAYFPGPANFMHPDIHELKFNPLNNSLFCGNDGGVYKNNVTTWDSKFVGLNSTQFYHFERESDELKLWGGAQDNGIIKQDVGTNYFNYKFGDGYDVMTDHNYLTGNGEGNNLYYTLNTGIFRDGSFIGISTNNSQYFGNLAMSPVDEDKIYVGYRNGVYGSLNAGSFWGNYGASGNWCISNCRNNDNRIYAAGDGSGSSRLFRMDFVSTVTNITNITPPAPYNINLKITDIDVNPTNSSNLWVSVGGDVANAKVFATFNGGTNWINLTFNLPNVPIFCIKRDASNGLYVGTSIGVFYKPNTVNNWEPFSNGLPPTPVTEIELWPEPNPVGGIVPSYAPATPEVWISTFGRGIWYTQQYITNCDVNLTLSGAVSGQLLKEVTNNITSSQNLQGGAGTNIKYNAYNYILLTDGFSAPLGTKFQTFTTGCGNQVDLNKTTNPTPPPTPPLKPKEPNN